MTGLKTYKEFLRLILNILKTQTAYTKSGFNWEAIFSAFSVFLIGGQLVVLANGFQKKTQKTPKQEIELALKIKKEYESEK